MSIPSSLLYQGPPETALKLHYVRRRIEEVDGPAAILDVAVARKNCEAMLRTAERLGVQFRAHVKTHKVWLSFSFYLHRQLRCRQNFVKRLSSEDSNIHTV